MSVGLAQGTITLDVNSGLFALTKRADDLLYAAKGTGKNKVCM